MSVTAEYISASCNRAVNVSDCRAEDGLVAFGSGRLVALWRSANAERRGVHKTLASHSANVSVLKFAVTTVGQSSLLVGDASGTVKLWREDPDGNWTVDVSFGGHAQSISTITSIPHPAHPDKLLACTGGSEGTIKVWLIGKTSIECIQQFEINGKIPLDLALVQTPNTSDVLLAVGSTQSNLLLYTASSASSYAFSKAVGLQGHTDWIRCLDFLPARDPAVKVDYDIAADELLLASGSQDNYIRLWRFKVSSSEASSKSRKTGLDALDELEAALDDVNGEIKIKSYDFSVGPRLYSCTSDSVLLGHDSWVTGNRWAPPHLSDGHLKLLSSSSDRSMILWAPSLDPSISATVWTSHQRFGEFSSQTNLGFFDARWGKDAHSVLAHGWGGSFHVWTRENEEHEWSPAVSISGHYEPVKSLSWEPQGQYLLSASLDMSSRLHGPWRRSGLETWHELARPQIHGHPIESVAFTDRLQFVSGADEKVVRVFDAPKLFLSNMKQISGIGDLGYEADRPFGASVPPLGLSNRAIAGQEEAQKTEQASRPDDPFDYTPIHFEVTSQPPFEEQMLGSTLWPEVEKLYGHGYEIMTVASAHSSPLIASACRATATEHASVIFYDTNTWRQFGKPCEGHSLTITKVVFSPNDRYLLSVSRDRSWRLYERTEDGYVASATTEKPHARIIWDAAWATDGSFFATASRDKTVKIWQAASAWSCIETLRFDEAATAVTFTELNGAHLMAVGLEDGRIELFRSRDGTDWQSALKIDSSIGHVLAVNSLTFRPQDGQVQLASASDDATVRILNLSSSV